MAKTNEPRPEEPRNPEVPPTPAPVQPAAAAPEGITEEQMMAAVDKYLSKRGNGGMTDLQLEKVLRAVQEKPVSARGTINPSFVKAEDTVEEFTLFSPHSYDFLRTKEVAGMTVGLPYEQRMLAFEKDYPRTVLIGGVAKRQYTCRLRSKNHELYKWCTGHDIKGNLVCSPDPRFGVEYFLDPAEMVVDGFDIWEKLFAGHKTGLDQRPHHELLTIAHTECGIAPNSVYAKEVLASRIAKKRADEQFAGEKSRTYAERQAAASLSAAMFGQQAPAVQI